MKNASQPDPELGSIHESVRCYRCGSGYVRLATHPNPLDAISKLVGFTTFRCLSCYGRFRIFRADARGNRRPAGSVREASPGSTPDVKKPGAA